MMHNAGCWKLLPAVLVIVTSLLTGCVTVGFEADGAGACPPVVAYDTRFQSRAADELLLLPDGSAVVELVADYVVLREQVRGCDGKQ